MTEFLQRLWPEEKAQSLAEYILLLVLISLAAVTTTRGLALRINQICSEASSHMKAASFSASAAGGSLGSGTSLLNNTLPNTTADDTQNPD